MSKLINVELMKVFKHKSIYIMLIIIFLFCLLNNILYKNDYDENGNYKYEIQENLDDQIKELEEELDKYNLDNVNDKNIYVTIKSNLDIFKIKKKYDNNAWQYIKSNDYLYESVYNINYYTYVDDNPLLLEKSYQEYHEKIIKFENDDWEYFVKLEKNSLENEIKDYEVNIDVIEDKELRQKLIKELDILSSDMMVINYRLNQGISYSNTYLNKALLEYRESLNYINNNSKIVTYQDRINYNKNLENLNVNKYIIENKQNVDKVNELNYQLRSIVDDYELFIIIIILIVASILIGEEFNRGTIKLLLIKPYSRNKILLSKYMAGIIMIIFVIMFIMLSQLLIGGVIFGFDSLEIPVVIYNFGSLGIEKINIFVYMLLRIVVRLPMLVLILILSYVIGILSNNTIASFSITILLYTFSEVINGMIINYNLKFMQYFVTMNWNFGDYLFGGLSVFEYINLKKSILIYLIYVIILLAIMFVSFRKKNIKNV